MPRITATNHVNPPFSPNDFTILTNSFYACTNFHGFSSNLLMNVNGSRPVYLDDNKPNKGSEHKITLEFAFLSFCSAETGPHTSTPSIRPTSNGQSFARPKSSNNRPLMTWPPEPLRKPRAAFQFHQPRRASLAACKTQSVAPCGNQKSPICA